MYRSTPHGADPRHLDPAHEPGRADDRRRRVAHPPNDFARAARAIAGDHAVAHAARRDPLATAERLPGSGAPGPTRRGAPPHRHERLPEAA